MASSYAHKFGEFIGTFFENAMKNTVKKLVKTYGLYFDSYGYRKARGKDKLTWKDINGSHHDLDYVIEDGGTETVIGTPVAFIELAWRRYTKHSKNKVQEIQGAINPIYEKYKLTDPFKGAILCGDFTQNSINQLADDNFHVLYIPYSSLITTFGRYGIDISYDENTSEEWFRNTLDHVSAMTLSDKHLMGKISKRLIHDNKDGINKFIGELSQHFDRRIKYIQILPLHGSERDIESLDKAISFIQNYDIRLCHLAPIILRYMGWVGYHLEQFVKDRNTFYESKEEIENELDDPDKNWTNIDWATVTIGDVLKKKGDFQQMIGEYDED